ncbi:MAG: hypothetical protein ACTSR9_12765 [Candidatus Thorarchaeota archaeon]
MSEPFYFDRLKDTLEGLERCQYDDDKYWGLSVSISDLRYESYQNDISLTEEQESFVYKAALEHLKMGIRSKFSDLCCILAYTGTKYNGEEYETSLTLHPDYKDGCSSPFEIAIDLLKSAGVFETDEAIRYYDRGTISVQKKSVGRTGVLILTDRRIICAGGFSTNMSSKVHKLYYGDLKEPYLSTVDFIHFNRAKDIELKKNEIRMKYDTDYIIEKERTFYGPYFFTFDLPKSIKVKKGTMKVIISLGELEKKVRLSSDAKDTDIVRTYKAWNKVEIPKDYDRVRLDTFFRHLTSLGPVYANNQRCGLK